MEFTRFKDQFEKVKVVEFNNDLIPNPVVSVCIQTFQHSSYIKDCLEGVLMQKTTFPFEILLGEDGSTDGTREICLDYAKRHPDKIKLFLHHRENNIRIKGRPTGRFNFLYNYYSAKGKYIALCEGDDYWTDPLKLQKQVHFMETNSQFSICWTKYLTKKENSDKKELLKPDWINYLANNSNHEINLNNIFSPYCTYTLTSLFRRNAFDISLFKKMKFGKDNSIYAICLNNGKGVLLDFYSGVYRIHGGGIYSNTSLFRQNYLSYLNLKEIMQLMNKCDNENLRGIRNYHLEKSILLIESGFTRSIVKIYFDAFRFLGFKKGIRLLINKFHPSFAENG